MQPADPIPLDNGKLIVAAEFLAVLRENGLDSFESIMAVPRADVVRSVPGRSTVRLELPGFVGYLKRYEPRYLPLWKKLLRLLHWPGFDDEAAREWRKILLLRSHGFLTATAVARGQSGFASFLLQQQIPGGTPADEVLQKLPTSKRRQLLAEIGALARQLRNAGFIHKDLYLKHIFVVERADGWELYLIDLQRVLGPRRHRLRWYVKDAAALVYSVQAHAGGSRADALRLLKSYGADRRFLRRVWRRARRLARRTPKYKRIWTG